MKLEKKPSDFAKKIPILSKAFERNREIVANLIMQALAETGDKWRRITKEEFMQLVLRDVPEHKHICEMFFNDVVAYTVSSLEASNFSSHW